MKKNLLLFSFLLSALAASAQTAKEEIYADVLKAGSNHMAYQVPTQPLTKAPKGYTPFYMSHYGRHGSRWLLNENDYLNVLRPLRRAKELGVLTPLGMELWRSWSVSIPARLTVWATFLTLANSNIMASESA